MRRTLISLAVAALFGAAGGAVANPTGAEVVHGSAEVAAAGKVLTVTPSAGAVINWRGFAVAPDETIRFVLPAPSATVLNRVLGADFSVLGRLENNGRALFLSSGQVSGGGLALDLPGINVAALRLSRPLAPAIGAGERREPGVARALAEWVLMIVPESAPFSTSPRNEVLVPTGNTVELVDRRWPHVRVLITAPPGEALNLSRLVEKSGALGIYGSLLAVPRGRATGETEPTTALAQGSEDAAEIRVALGLVAAAPVESGAFDRDAVAVHAARVEPVALALTPAVAGAFDDAVAPAMQPEPVMIAEAPLESGAFDMDAAKPVLPLVVAEAPVASGAFDEDAASAAHWERVLIAAVPIESGAFDQDAVALAPARAEPVLVAEAASGAFDDGAAPPPGPVLVAEAPAVAGAFDDGAAPALQLEPVMLAEAPLESGAFDMDAPIPVQPEPVLVAEAPIASGAFDEDAATAAHWERVLFAAAPTESGAFDRNAAAQAPARAGPVLVAEAPLASGAFDDGAAPALNATSILVAEAPLESGAFDRDAVIAFLPPEARIEPAPARVFVASAEPGPRPAAAMVRVAAVEERPPVKLARVERPLPMIMFDRKGGMFHL